MKLLWSIIFLSSNCYAIDYNTAFNNAQEAAYIQSGLKNLVGQTQSYFESQSIKVVRKVGIEKELGFILGGVKIYRDKSINFPIGNKKVRITTDRILVTIGF